MSTENTAAPAAAHPLPRCPQCGGPIETPVARRIIDRGWNPVLRKQFVRERTVEFCSGKCGGDYQMGCEG